MNDFDYFSYLYEIARCLNKEFSLHAALRKALEKSVQLLGLETGWIWLMQENKAVYLAASYNLPPALADYPERLSGNCYCIEKYLSNKMEKPANISEIGCSRLKNLKSGTKELKFHATVPIRVNDQKVGLINLLSKDHLEFNQSQLCLLSTVGELIGIAVQRTRAQDVQEIISGSDKAMHQTLKRVFKPKIQELVRDIEMIKSNIPEGNQEIVMDKLNAAAKLAGQLSSQLSHILEEYERASRATVL